MGFLRPYLPRVAVAAITLMVALSFLTSSTSLAQERGSLGRRVRSPEVSDDHKITFRLQAPNAKSVSVTGDFTGKTIEITHEFTESPGYRHDYQIWRIYLNTVLQKLFRE